MANKTATHSSDGKHPLRKPVVVSVPTFQLAFTVTSVVPGLTPGILAETMRRALEDAGFSVDNLSCAEVK